RERFVRIPEIQSDRFIAVTPDSAIVPARPGLTELMREIGDDGIEGSHPGSVESDARAVLCERYGATSAIEDASGRQHRNRRVMAEPDWLRPCHVRKSCENRGTTCPRLVRHSEQLRDVGDEGRLWRRGRRWQATRHGDGRGRGEGPPHDRPPSALSNL